MNDYIFLNNKPFQYINRTYAEPKIGSKLERTLSGKGTRDVICTKRKWIFTFEIGVDYRYLRLQSIFNLNSSFVLKDWDLQSYTVLAVNDFSPQFDGSLYTITLELEEE